jgi:hypothetical protein
MRDASPATCHPNKPRFRLGLCLACYTRKRRAEPVSGDNRRKPECHPERRHYSGGLCESCYGKNKRRCDPKREQKLKLARERGKAKRREWRVLHPAKKSGPRPHTNKGPSECHPGKREFAHGLCRACYIRERRNNPNDPRWASKWARKPVCHPERRHYAHGKCEPCYHQELATLQRLKAVGAGGVTYDELLAKQDHRCSICRSLFTGWNGDCASQIDHCHDTNEFRGLLCRSCNLLLGYAKDSIEILQSAIRYLEAFNSKTL